ncbi:hypothetical protein EPD60_15375 [Flaviaesturariibacter flavus]|uniref:FHA domain-containing protein n=1 Tax=Flaviaesturariibacter flavus TaxID=2502780 RepID=A0A4R1B846_9BACT|nr:hypothetical protein [Flaviaesturariibacter flavus]TCJ12645.1 hypothetical protein EPD60_15375 [Flaviaesturariibacter flavus]
MSDKPSFWQRLGLHDWFVNKPEAAVPERNTGLSPERIYQFIQAQFGESVRTLSFANRVVFYQEYIVVFHPDDYARFQQERKGLLGMIAQECVTEFTRVLQEAAQAGRTVMPAGARWVFRFVSHPGYAPGDLGFIGKLLPEGGGQEAQPNLRVTYIPRQTGRAETSELSADSLSAFTYYSEGYYELPFRLELPSGKASGPSGSAGANARFEAIVPDREYAGKRIEFLMTGDEVMLTGPADPRNGGDVFRVPSEWVDTPHLHIRFSRAENKFYLAAFGEKTVVNEKEAPRSAPQQPDWIELPLNSRIVLNGIVGVNFYKA